MIAEGEEAMQLIVTGNFDKCVNLMDEREKLIKETMYEFIGNRFDCESSKLMAWSNKRMEEKIKVGNRDVMLRVDSGFKHLKESMLVPGLIGSDNC